MAPRGPVATGQKGRILSEAQGGGDLGQTSEIRGLVRCQRQRVIRAIWADHVVHHRIGRYLQEIQSFSLAFGKDECLMIHIERAGCSWDTEQFDQDCRRDLLSYTGAYHVFITKNSHPESMLHRLESLPTIDPGIWTDLLVIANAAAKIAGLGDEGGLGNRRGIGTGLGKHVAHLSDLALRLLRRGPECLAEREAVGILQSPFVLTKQWPAIRIGEWKHLAVAEIEQNG